MVITLRSRRGKPRRVGVVLGAGGVLGAAWSAGALTALQQRLDLPLSAADVIVGTSSGSVLAAALRCGVDVAEIVEHQRAGGLAALPDPAGSRPPEPRLRCGSPRLLASTARAARKVHPWVAASALIPPGRASHASLSQLVDGLLARSSPAEAAWPQRPTWIVAVDYDSGRRVAFGRTGAPEVTLPDAVVASCSIPGWYEPKQIGDRRYIDGGIRSSTSLGLLSRVRLDDVFVLAPMASFAPDKPRNPAWRAERLLRQFLTNALVAEARKVADATGARVHALTPGADDLAVMGMNLMDQGRRGLVLETSLATSPGQVAGLALAA
ncbi:MAG: patatin-like phospholipase family protein [Hamadaea sp.]|nr:patatin-like phospholipase family protein [Hamadaea sp.]